MQCTDTGDCRLTRRLHWSIRPARGAGRLGGDMATVNSVLGPFDTADLGFTLTHEHIFTASAGIQQTFPELFGDFQKLTDQVVLTLNEAREGGVKTIVDLSTLDLGRDIRFLADMSRRT